MKVHKPKMYLIFDVRSSSCEPAARFFSEAKMASIFCGMVGSLEELWFLVTSIAGLCKRPPGGAGLVLLSKGKQGRFGLMSLESRFLHIT